MHSTKYFPNQTKNTSTLKKGCCPRKTVSTWRFPLWTLCRRSFRAVCDPVKPWESVGKSMDPWPNETRKVVETCPKKQGNGGDMIQKLERICKNWSLPFFSCPEKHSRESDEEVLRMLANTTDGSVWNTYFLPETWTHNQPTLCGRYPKNGPGPNFAGKRTRHLQPWGLWLGLIHYQCPHFLNKGCSILRDCFSSGRGQCWRFTAPERALSGKHRPSSEFLDDTKMSVHEILVFECI